jgi:hypothetical protein
VIWLTGTPADVAICSSTAALVITCAKTDARVVSGTVSWERFANAESGESTRIWTVAAPVGTDEMDRRTAAAAITARITIAMVASLRVQRILEISASSILPLPKAASTDATQHLVGFFCTADSREECRTTGVS